MLLVAFSITLWNNFAIVDGTIWNAHGTYESMMKCQILSSMFNGIQ
jgi:hypothetical protein